MSVVVTNERTWFRVEKKQEQPAPKARKQSKEGQGFQLFRLQPGIAHTAGAFCDW